MTLEQEGGESAEQIDPGGGNENRCQMVAQPTMGGGSRTGNFVGLVGSMGKHSVGHAPDYRPRAGRDTRGTGQSIPGARLGTHRLSGWTPIVVSRSRPAPGSR